MVNQAKEGFSVICPFCGQPAQRYQIRRLQQAKAQRLRPSIRGTQAAKERAQKAANARWQKAKSK
jgi:hypothetical protein